MAIINGIVSDIGIKGHIEIPDGQGFCGEKPVTIFWMFMSERNRTQRLRCTQHI
jgi:hypothetical protein